MNIKTTIGNNKIAALSRINHTFQDFPFKMLVFIHRKLRFGSQKLILQQDEVTNNSTEQKIAACQLLF